MVNHLIHIKFDHPVYYFYVHTVNIEY